MAADSLMRAMFMQRMLAAQERERQQITAEIAKVRGLMPLLMKRRNGGHWTVDERHELIEQFHALAHLSPYLVILALPGSVLALPVLAWWLDRRRQRRRFSQFPGTGKAQKNPGEV
jgi:hypothetical protein